MAICKITVDNFDFQFSDQDVILDEYDPKAKEGDRYLEIPWLIHEQGFTICVVFARNEQEAFDQAVNENKLDRYMIENPTEEDWEDENYHVLGNASELFDTSNLGIVRLLQPNLSYCTLLNNHLKENPSGRIRLQP